ncbi:hypothetical protein EVS84_03805 [Pseudomonas koreensis]|uniref:Uncharacterized protein n=1 Tax=Pseudomonas koreensis TaxID=198620 RepID=A0A4V1WIE4_9PSED|nr:hypothetical protein EVS84_03805 [Pseudomonas koreensis]
MVLVLASSRAGSLPHWMCVEPKPVGASPLAKATSATAQMSDQAARNEINAYVCAGSVTTCPPAASTCPATSSPDK